jgi:hypothetical protein
MSSSLALRNELRSIILRGVQRLRGIEIARELAEELLLEARMIYAAAVNESDDSEWAPEPEEIRAACAVIQSNWTEEEREQRWRIEYTSTREKRQIADFHYLTVNEGELAGYAERGQRYRYYNRERIRERRRKQLQDPAKSDAAREYMRRWREKNKFRRKETDAANREQANAARREANALRREELRERARQFYAANREVIRQQQREFREAHREELNARKRELTAEQRELVNEQQRQRRARRRAAKMLVAC